LEGNSYGAVARILEVNQYTAKLPHARMPEKVKKAELDEWYTFLSGRKNEIYILTIVDRDIRVFWATRSIWNNYISPTTPLP